MNPTEDEILAAYLRDRVIPTIPASQLDLDDVLRRSRHKHQMRLGAASTLTVAAMVAGVSGVVAVTGPDTGAVAGTAEGERPDDFEGTWQEYAAAQLTCLQGAGWDARPVAASPGAGIGLVVGDVIPGDVSALRASQSDCGAEVGRKVGPSGDDAEAWALYANHVRQFYCLVDAGLRPEELPSPEYFLDELRAGRSTADPVAALPDEQFLTGLSACPWLWPSAETARPQSMALAAGPSAELEAALADGVVSFEEYYAGAERYVACLTNRGYPTELDPEMAGDLVSYGIRQEAVHSGADAICYDSEFGQLDSQWQLDHIETSEQARRLTECLEEHGLPVPNTFAEKDQAVREADVNYCMEP